MKLEGEEGNQWEEMGQGTIGAERWQGESGRMGISREGRERKTKELVGRGSELMLRTA